MKKRASGVVQGVHYDNDHGDTPTIWIRIDFGCFEQSFGGLIMGAPERDDFVRRVCDLFDVGEIGAIVGKSVTGLWCLGEHNETMEGIERGGQRLTITGFRRVHWPDKVTSALDARRASIESTIRWAERRVAEERARLATLETNWTEWETAPLM